MLQEKRAAQGIGSIDADFDLFQTFLQLGQRAASEHVCNWAERLIECTDDKAPIEGFCPSKVVLEVNYIDDEFYSLYKCIPRQPQGTDVCNEHGDFETRCEMGQSRRKRRREEDLYCAHLQQAGDKDRADLFRNGWLNYQCYTSQVFLLLCFRHKYR